MLGGASLTNSGRKKGCGVTPVEVGEFGGLSAPKVLLQAPSCDWVPPSEVEKER